MPSRWRGPGGLAIIAILAAATVALGTVAAAGTTVGADPMLIVRGPDERVLARVALPDGWFTLRYRNSLYGSLAEERYEVGPRGELTLVELAADELAVLEEYSSIDGAAERTVGADRAWRADPALDVRLEQLVVAATDLGERTLVVAGADALALWQLVADADPSVRLTVELP